MKTENNITSMKNRAKDYSCRWNKFRISMGNSTFKKSELMELAKSEKLPYYKVVPNKLEENNHIEIVGKTKMINGIYNIYKFTGKPIEWLVFMDILDEARKRRLIEHRKVTIEQDNDKSVFRKVENIMNSISLYEMNIEDVRKSLIEYIHLDSEDDKLRAYARMCNTALYEVKTKDRECDEASRLEDEFEEILKEKDKEIEYLKKKNDEIQNRCNMLIDKFIFKI